jgi:hypothetical protein
VHDQLQRVVVQLTREAPALLLFGRDEERRIVRRALAFTALVGDVHEHELGRAAGIGGGERCDIDAVVPAVAEGDGVAGERSEGAAASQKIGC